MVSGRHSLPEVWRRPRPRVRRVGRGSTSAAIPRPRSPATSASASGPMGGTSTRSPRSASSPSVRRGTASRAASFGSPPRPPRRSSRTQWRKASTRVRVPASPAWPSVSMTANGFPSMRKASWWPVKLSGPQA